ncbi:MAG: hypothetical protein P8J20_09095 [Novosphingobium sp.]|nr:hypothetical protein [Novosphingobium sp.]
MSGVAVLGALLASSPSQAANGLECILGGYTAEQQQVFADYYSGFTAASLEQEDASDAHVNAIATRAVACAGLHSWPPDAITNAVYYRLSNMLAHALELKTPLTPEQMVSLNATLENADQTRLRATLGPGIEASMAGEEGPEMSDEDKTYLGLLVIQAGLPTDRPSSEFFGALLGARMMADIAAEKFAKNSSEETQ